MTAVARRLVLILGLPVILLVVWWFVSAGSTTYYLPPLSAILDAFGRKWTGGALRDHVLPSVARLSLGYVLGVGAAVVLGVLIGLVRPVRAATEPVFEFFRAFPPPVLVPVIMLFAGIGDTMKVIVIAMGCLWPVLLNTVEGVRGLDGILSDTSRAYRITGLARLRHLVLRGASPQIMTGARQAMAIAIILMVISEMFAPTNGLGYSIVEDQRTFAIPEMWSGIILLGLLGVAYSLLLRVVEWRVLAWHRGLRRARRS
ncbi:ABC transporter permease [Luedemannella flava]|uniref:ABC transporter permease n=1 Tax=Luedemannella flava TaxID=349316 RepID=A0ABN2LNV3_9ACTN